MSASITLVVLMAVMYGAGVYVMLEKSLTRILIGFLLVGNATNLLIFIMSGRAGDSPIVDGNGADTVDPIPQVLMLTAIVINFGVTAFILALIYRSWWLSNLGDEGDDVAADDDEDEAMEIDQAGVFHASLEDDDAAVRTILDEGSDLGDDDDSASGSAGEEPSERDRDVMR
ncbi:NADH-quinone oxidoreductase subunit K [Herbiconiux sp. VKM Ac-2851]|uniref:NADH-quinone oxidoreductase subunit K n=1 Tax=Herbiconiux sp. VKM Ac-2851 TaxID=2739025 RepID=UPI001563ED97|nr:NADH-quinone oxidoreductase subunit K [Herbiconiux sp. VKM Ac-2851]NQX35099.1 NADH-quinone oxidoreductase subunit K [Herbiconiux sp. VKM Ac-2851]